MCRAPEQDEWNIQIKVNPTQVRDLLGHPVRELKLIKTTQGAAAQRRSELDAALHGEDDAGVADRGQVGREADPPQGHRRQHPHEDRRVSQDLLQLELPAQFQQ